MTIRRSFPVVAIASLLAVAACNGGDTRTVEQDTMVTTVPRQDTIAVERQVDVHTDTVIDTRP